jgi:group I intron endonuclease
VCRFGIIYKAIGPIGPNGKIYIGKSLQALHRRKIEHKSNAFNKNIGSTYYSHFYNAIRNYGIDNFKWSILEDGIPVEFLNDREKYYIKKYNTYNIGYNSTIGGDGSFGFKHSMESRAKMSKSTEGQVVSQETREKLSKMRKGKRKTKEHIEKIRKANIGKISGKKHPNYGKKLSKEVIQKSKRTKRTKQELIQKPFFVFDKDTGCLIGEWKTMAQCVEDLNLTQSLLYKCLKKERKSHKGYVFEYKEDQNVT